MEVPIAEKRRLRAGDAAATTYLRQEGRRSSFSKTATGRGGGRAAELPMRPLGNGGAVAPVERPPPPQEESWAAPVVPPVIQVDFNSVPGAPPRRLLLERKRRSVSVSCVGAFVRMHLQRHNNNILIIGVILQSHSSSSSSSHRHNNDVVIIGDITTTTPSSPPPHPPTAETTRPRFPACRSSFTSAPRQSGRT